MKITHNARGFEMIAETNIYQSSAIGDYEDSFDRPGSSFLWINGDHFDREDVQWLVGKDDWSDMHLPEEARPHLQAWLDTGSLVVSE